MSGGDDDDRAAFEEALSACIEAFEAGGVEGAARVDAVCAQNPALAARLRARLASLERLGLLGASEQPATVGRYRVLRRLGRGGMATVYLARDPRDGALVALKSAAAPLGHDSRARVRFEREVRALEGLRHPGLVPVLDSGEDGGRPFFTMEYVEGCTLAEVVAGLRRADRPVEDLSAADVLALAGGAEAVPAAGGPELAGSYVELATRIVLQVAEALEQLHAHGVLHRDVKPSNVLLAPDGRARLFDLGLAHVEDQPALTRSGDFAGTPYYVSPEQVARGPRGLDARSDVHSLGVTLFELLTLRRPFEGRSTAEVLRAIALDEPPLLRRLNPRVPRGLESVCLTAMEKDPSRRYASARELADDLRRFLDLLPVRARPVGTLVRGARFVRRHPARAAAWTLAAVVAVGLPTGLALSNRAVRAQRDLAAKSAAEAQRQVDRNARQIDFLVELFDSAGAAAGTGEPLGARAVLDRSAERIEAQFEGEPLVRAALMEATGRVYARLGLHERALHLLDRAFAILQRELGEQHVDAAGVLAVLAEVHLAAGSPDDAEALARRALESFEVGGERSPAADLRCRLTLADALVARGRPGEARALLATLPAAGRAGAERSAIERRLGDLARAEGARGEARAHYERAVDALARAVDPDLGVLARLLEALAAAEQACGDGPAARRATARAGHVRSALAAQVAAPAADGGLEPLLAAFGLLPPWTEACDRTFQEGITALQSGRPREALPLFERCLEWQPDRPVCAYNLACAHALLGEAEAALEWFERAASLGMGAVDARWESMQRDPDLEAIRGEPRYERVLERVRAARARTAAELEQPAFRPPSGERADGPWPLVLALHADGEDREALLRGPLAAAADELGLALLAPSGPLPLGIEAGDGRRWFEDVRELARRPGLHAGRLLDLLAATLDRETVDPERVYLLGEGAAAPLAFDLAARAPGRFAGVLLLDGTPSPLVSEGRLRRAAALELCVHVVVAHPERLPGAGVEGVNEQAPQRVDAWLGARGIPRRVAWGPRPEPRSELLVDELRRLLAPGP